MRLSSYNFYVSVYICVNGVATALEEDVYILKAKLLYLRFGKSS